MENASLIDLAVQCGADKAAVIDVSQVILSEQFREICKSNGCGNYGRCWMCPPDVGDIFELMDKVRSYDKALVFQTIRPLEDSFDFEGMTAASADHAKVSEALRDKTAKLLGPDAWTLSCGGCRICETCAKRDGLPCRFPDRALASLESCGIDVYNTVAPTDLRYINGPDTVTYFGMVLYHE